jgi:uncharacterized protein involved in exopolysaccharide biosynthesis
MTKMFFNSSPKSGVDNFYHHILCFLGGAYKRILIFGLLGVCVAAAYLFFTPKRYESTAQITMAQISPTYKQKTNNISLGGINIEEPILLIARMSLPTNYSDEAIAACGLDKKLTSATLSKVVKITPGKGASNMVEVKIHGSTPQVAEQCAKAVFQLIKTHQAQLLALIVEEAKTTLFDDELRLEKAKEFISKADKSSADVGATYLSIRDEMRYLLDEISDLKRVMRSSEIRATRLVSPIYVNNTPLGPSQQIILMYGLFVGLLLGLFVCVAYQKLLETRNEEDGVQ